MKRLGASVLGLLLVTAPAFAQAPGSEAARAKARGLLQEAGRAHEQGDYTGALGLFQEAYRTFPSPRLFFNIGQAQKRLGRPVDATESFERFLAEAKDAPPDAAAEARRSLTELREQVAHLEIVSNVAGAEVVIDGRSHGTTPLAKPAVVAAGPHQVVVQKAGAATYLRRIQADGGATLKIDAHLGVGTEAPPPAPVPSAPLPPAPEVLQPDLTASPPPPAPPPATWPRNLALGLAIAAPVLAAAGIYFGTLARDEAKTINDSCAQGCKGSDIVDNDRSRRQLGATQWVLLGTAGAAVVGATVLFIGGSW